MQGIPTENVARIEAMSWILSVYKVLVGSSASASDSDSASASAWQNHRAPTCSATCMYCVSFKYTIIGIGVLAEETMHVPKYSRLQYEVHLS